MLQSLLKLTHNNRVHLLWLMNLIYRLFAGFGGTLHAWILATYFIAMMEITSISFSKAAWTLGQLLASLLIRLYLNQHWVPHGVHNYRWCLYWAIIWKIEENVSITNAKKRGHKKVFSSLTLQSYQTYIQEAFKVYKWLSMTFLASFLKTETLANPSKTF